MSQPGFLYRQGRGPLVVSMPHIGTAFPPECEDDYTELGRSVCDTDWHIDRLYEFLPAFDAAIVAANWSRWVVDLNRDPANRPLYPGAYETGLCPTKTFDGEPIYRPDREPDGAEVERRLEHYWRPYHRQLAQALTEARERNGFALLLDAHSIASECPKLFEGRLPDVNFGTNSGRSCDREVIAGAIAAMKDQGQFSWVVDGRFKGGWITRNYGDPNGGIHAIQIELAQSAYMDEKNPSHFDPAVAVALRDTLKKVLECALEATRQLSARS